MTDNRFNTKRIALIALFTAIMTICSWISVPLTVPVTLQTFAVFVACGVLGGLDGLITVCVYLILGAIGLPVFSGFTGGPAKIAGPTGGYMLGFIFIAIIMWIMKKTAGDKLYALIISMLIGLIVCYTFGTAWFVLGYLGNDNPMDVVTALTLCVFPFIIPDIIKIILATTVIRSLRRFRILQ